ncbi:YbjN domain-containing protein [candidate division KSB1 bacterium]|nr:YbjN domain-containing protein [candidate division KSB1 bacterium]NIR71001.1 YbjN domain-containing protein [candidate division KSB1 bacterium]NIS24742.1 YbjN domain-containing protein [candidate division KSB1 bacterium]NIT71646.1 YbjN domain-containing protein [candidate division KSB1 bacterium]NIU25353.1 YbjN domain-containing protein [candidate division KSB1 bacterium]
MSAKIAVLTVLILNNALLCQESEQRSAADVMTFSELDNIIHNFSSQVEQGPNYWQFRDGEIQLICVVDTTYDRMRIIAPIIEASELTEEHKDRMLEANFHSALDARYGISNGIVYSAFIHPLSSLQESEMRSALKQVSVLAMTFGTSYSSGALQFGGTQSEN